MSEPAGIIGELLEELTKLPGIGPKSAERIAHFLLGGDRQRATALADALKGAAEQIRPCRECFNLTDRELCPVCSDPKRDAGLICVVETPRDVNSFERAGNFRGLYHVLGGRLSPLDGIGPGELNITALLGRIGEGSGVQEVVMATNPSVEGEATALYLHKLIGPLGLRVTRIARGLPIGGDLEYADGVTIAEALHGRREL